MGLWGGRGAVKEDEDEPRSLVRGFDGSEGVELDGEGRGLGGSEAGGVAQNQASLMVFERVAGSRAGGSESRGMEVG